MRARLPVGVIGVGSLGWHHARHLATMPEAELVGVYDILPGRTAHVAEALGTRAFRSREELLREVRAVTVAVPTTAHAEVALAAVEAGLPTLVEKPFTATLAEADRLIAEAERQQVLLQVGHIERYNRALRAAAPFLGRPLFIEGERLAPFQLRGTELPVVLDLMIHELDLVLQLAGSAEISDLRANGAAVLTPLVDVAHARLEFDSGLVASVTASRIAQERVRRLRIYQEEGYLVLDLASGHGEFRRLRAGWKGPWRQGKAGDPEGGLDEVTERIPLEAPPTDAMRLELESFLGAVQEGSPPDVSGRDGRAALALALQVSDAIGLATPTSS